MYPAVLAWRTVLITLAAYRAGKVGRAAVEHTIDNWYAVCERQMPKPKEKEKA